MEEDKDSNVSHKESNINYYTLHSEMQRKKQTRKSYLWVFISRRFRDSIEHTYFIPSNHFRGLIIIIVHEKRMTTYNMEVSHLRNRIVPLCTATKQCTTPRKSSFIN
jgi:hypothetical protein